MQAWRVNGVANAQPDRPTHRASVIRVTIRGSAEFVLSEEFFSTT